MGVAGRDEAEVEVEQGSKGPRAKSVKVIA
jgi:cold shock CspA family protein